MESTAIFAMNPRLKDSRTGKAMGKYHRGYAEPATAEQVMKRLADADVREDVRLIREEGHEELKDEGLFTLCPHYSRFRNNHRAQADILAEAFTWKTCIDVDEKPLVERAIKKALELNADRDSRWQGTVVYIEYSPRKKCHIWLRMPAGMTIEETQRAFCSELEVPYDPSCVTPERYINMTGDEVYRSDDWLRPLPADEVEKRREAFRQRGLDTDGRPLRKAETTTAATATTQAEATGADDRTRYIVGECLREADLSVSDLNEVGGRHNAVKAVLSVGITQLLTQGEFIGVMQELAPTYSQDKNFLQLVSDFYDKYTDPVQKMTQFQRRVFARSRKMRKNGTERPERPDTRTAPTSQALHGDTASLADIYGSDQPPLPPQKLPRLVQIVASQTPAELKATVEQGMFPPLGVYPQKLSFLYIDNQYRELRLSCLTIGGTGTGKDTSLKQPLKHLTAPLVERDMVNRQRLKEYNEQYNSTKSNKDKPKRPSDLIIQKVGADLTPARLSQLMDDSQGAFLYTQLNEFEQWYGIEGVRGQACTFKNLKLADDEDNPFGQERAGAQSVNYMGPLGLNWNASTTPGKAQQMFRYTLVDGPVSRVCLATTPSAGLAAPMPRFGRYDERYDQALRPYIERLREATGEVVCYPAIRLAERLKAECDQYTLVTQDEVFDNLSHRALVHAFRKACLLFAANGMKWEKTIEGFCRWSLHYDLWLKLHFFGDLIRNADSQTHTSRRGPRNLLEQIGTDDSGVFTYREAVSARLKNGKEEYGTGNMLSQWKARGYIEVLPDGKFRKLVTDDR